MSDINIEFVEPQTIEINYPIVGVDGLDGQVVSVIAGDNITVDDTDPANPIVSTPDNLVTSVNGDIGTVVLTSSDVGADPSGSASTALTTANNYTDSEIASLSFVESVTAGTNVTIDNTDPQNPIVSASGGGGGAVDSVNTKTGVVVLDTGDIGEVTNKKYVTDAEKTKLSNTSGTNTGDETLSTIKSKLGITTLSGSNTGDQNLSGYVPTSRTINGQALTANVTLAKSDVGLSNVDNTSDASKPVSTAQQTALDLKENSANKAINFTTINNTLYPSVEAVQNAIIDAVTGLTNFRGDYDASVNVYPTTGGSGGGGNIRKGDYWYVSVAGTLDGESVTPGDALIAKINNPGNLSTEWIVITHSFNYVPENVANKNTDGTFSANSDTLYPSQKATKTYADTKLTANSTITGATKTKITYDAKGLVTAGADATKTDVGLSNVDNTSDASKPVSTATQTALDAKRTLARVTFSNANYVIVATKDSVISQTGTMSASRTVTLPLANSVPAGTEFTIIDQSGTVTATNTIVITRAGSDTINGATTEVIATAYSWRRIISDGTSSWNIDGGIVRVAATQTLTNKRITRRTVTVNAPGATPTMNTDNVNRQIFTGLNTAITSMTTNLTGTPVDGDMLEICFLDDGTARAITWGSSFVSSGTVTLPTTTAISTTLRVGFEYSTIASLNKWVCIAKA